MRVLSIYIKTDIIYNIRQIRARFVGVLHKNIESLWAKNTAANPKHPKKRGFRVVLSAF